MGLVKLIVAPSGRILGAGIVGRGAGELASLFALAITHNIEVSRLADLPAPHPSYAELARRLGEQAFAGSAAAQRLARRFRFNRLLP